MNRTNVQLGQTIIFNEHYNGQSLRRTGRVINTNYMGRIVVLAKGFSCTLDCVPSDVVEVVG